MKLTKYIKADFRILIALILILVFALIPLAFSQQKVNFCCEKTISGAWCQNTLEENCYTSINPSTNQPFRKTAASCQATSFCKPGCCVDTDEGLCMENTPEVVCTASTGTWNEDSQCNIPQCNLGCCILGDQASFVTQTRCKKLSSFYDLETNFNPSIKEETACILTAHLQDKGACVYEYNYQRTCKFTTREACMNLHGINLTSGAEFHEDFLCSADELATNCGPTTETICLEGKDEVYFKDTCGNPANIYDANKIYSKSSSYWQKIVPKKESCRPDSDNGNANSKTCGNCDYFRGSVCAKGKADYGDNICTDLNCYDTKNGNDFKNGESWCVYQGKVGKGRDLVGSRHFRHICINGEEVIEPCADFRNEVCIEEELSTADGNFIESGCRINRWLDCPDQNNDSCLNTDKRDCYWLEGEFSFDRELSEAPAESPGKVFSGGNTGGFGGGITGNAVLYSEKKEDKGACLPTVPPGLKFWESGNAQSICSLGSTVCRVKFEENIFGSEKCKDNCECLTIEWATKANRLCTSLGDCGAYVNIAGTYTSEGAEWKIDGKKKLLTGLLNKIKKDI